MVGINTAIFSQTGGSVGIGFAVSARLASPIVDQLKEFGRTRRGWLGVRIQRVTDEIAEGFGLDEARGALVAEVTQGGPAEAAGIKPGDVILSFNDREVGEMRKLPRIVAETPVGVDVPVEVWRDGGLKQVTARIGELEEAEKAQVVPASKTEGPGAVRDWTCRGRGAGAFNPDRGASDRTHDRRGGRGAWWCFRPTPRAPPPRKAFSRAT